MVVRAPRQAIILTTGNGYVRMSSGAWRDMKQMAEVMLADGGTWIVVPPNLESLGHIELTSQDAASDESIRETSTENDRRRSSEEFVVDLVMTIMPSIEYILLEGQLDQIKERSSEIGAMNARIDSIEEHIAAIDSVLDSAFERFDSIKSRF